MKWKHIPEVLLNGSHAAGRGPKVVSEDGGIIASVYRKSHAPGRCEVAEAHAQLIAQAPEMLRALEQLVTMLDIWQPLDSMPDSVRYAFDAAESAIAKATGEEHTP